MTSEQTEIYFIRHGESVANLSPEYVNGRMNESPLTDLGIQQAMAVGRFLRQAGVFPDTVAASPAVRTRQTAQYALSALGVTPNVVLNDDLQELDQGDWTGRLRTEVYTPEEYEKMSQRGKHFKGPNGESMHDVELRGRRVLDGYVDKPGTHFIFGHGLAIRCVVGSMYGWSHQEIYTAKTPNTSLTRVIATPDGWELVGEVGETPHLRAA